MERKDFLGYPYDDAHPAFIELPHPPHPKNAEGGSKFAYHRVTGRIYDLIALRKAATDADYALEGPEIGSDVAWLHDNTHLVPNTDSESLPDTLTILQPADGSTTTDPYYTIAGAGAEPDAEVMLWSSNRTPGEDTANATTTADEYGTFAFAGTHKAADGEETWTVTSGDATSAPVTVTLTTDAET